MSGSTDTFIVAALLLMIILPAIIRDEIPALGAILLLLYISIYLIAGFAERAAENDKYRPPYWSGGYNVKNWWHPVYICDPPLKEKPTKKTKKEDIRKKAQK